LISSIDILASSRIGFLSALGLYTALIVCEKASKIFFSISASYKGMLSHCKAKREEILLDSKFEREYSANEQ
jgi:hypothetical protein